jgi:hypothetical protein
MSAPQFVRGNYSDFYSSSQLPVLEAVFRYELMQSASQSKRDQLFNLRKTQRDIYQTTEMGDLPVFNTIPEGSDYTYSATNQGASKTIVPVKYGLGFSISEEAFDDGKFDEISDMTKKLAKSARETQELQAAAIFANAFTTQTTADGVALCSTSHTQAGGVGLRNRLSSDADLSVTSLETMLIDFETQFVGDTGHIYHLKPVKLVCNPLFARTAREILGSDLKANTSDNNMNPFKSEGIEVVSWSHLTSDTDAWFLLAEKSQTGLDIISRKPIETKAAGPDAGFDNDSIKYKSRYREKIDTVHPFGIFGSTGA